MSYFAQEHMTTPWANFGLAGLVIAALFGLVAMFAKWMVAYIDAQSMEHRAERMRWQEATDRERLAHREEREIFLKEFRDAIAAFTRSQTGS